MSLSRPVSVSCTDGSRDCRQEGRDPTTGNTLDVHGRFPDGVVGTHVQREV